MLTTPEATELWPTLGPIITSSGFPEMASTSRKNLAETFGGAASTNRSSRNINVSECESIDELVEEIDEEQAAKPPEYRPGYGNAIANALNQQAILNAVAGGGQKNKKKKRDKLLFTTCVRSYTSN